MLDLVNEKQIGSGSQLVLRSQTFKLMAEGLNSLAAFCRQG